MDSGLRDKVVLVTGASGGIGGACARAFAAEGAKLALHGHRNLAALSTLRAELKTESEAYGADLTKESDVEALFEQAHQRFGRIDAVVANAGIWPEQPAPIHEMTFAQWYGTIAANQTSVFLTARAYFRILARTKPTDASLLIVGSTAAVFGEEGHADYAASKAAIVYGLTRSLKNEIVRLVPRGRVNAVCPAWTRTPMAEEGLKDEAAVRRVLATHALKTIGRPEEIASAIVYLSSPKLASHVTGQVLEVTGGMEGRFLHELENIDPAKA